MKMYAFVRSNVPKALMFIHKSETESNNKTTTKAREIAEDENDKDGDCELRRRVASIYTVPSINGTRNSRLEEDTNIGTGMTTSHKGQRKVLRKQDSWISWDDENTPCPSFSRYLYFYFAPTLIYKDNYPR